MARPGQITPLAGAVAAGLFPAHLGPAWMDARDYRSRWHAWTCVKGPGGEATVHVLAPTAHDEPPDPRDLQVLRPLVAAIVRSYGVEPVEARRSPGGRHYRRHRDVRALVGGYLGVISFAAGAGERRHGGLVGLDGRVASDRGFAFAFDLELGYGAGELIGELRAGVGLSMGALDVVAGVGFGSIGPAAPMDLYGQGGLTVPLGDRSRAWLGGLYAVGVGGPDHLQADLKLVRTTRDDAGLFLGARLMWFGDDADTMADNGTALMVTFGGGVASD